MPKLIGTLVGIGLLIPAACFAEPRERWLGAQADVGVPDGVGLGVNVRPGLDWLRWNLSVTRAFGWGLRSGITISPAKFTISPSLTLEGGHVFSGTIPGIDSAPEVSYEYANLHAGLEFGSLNFRFFIHSGPSWMSVHTHNFADAIGNKDKSLSISNPNANIVFFPTLKLGFLAYF